MSPPIIPTLPAVDWLGYSLDMTTLTPLDIKVASAAVKKTLQIIKVNTDSSKARPVGGVQYIVPSCVAVIQDAKVSAGTYVTYASGSTANTAFRDDASSTIAYLATSVSSSTSYALARALSSSNQFAFYSFNYGHYDASLNKYLDLLAEDALKTVLNDLPTPFPDEPSKEVLAAYKSFFDKCGTDVIVTASYGARYQLIVWAPNNDEGLNKNFGRDVIASVNGITSSGKYDPSVTREDQYQAFRLRSQRLVSIQGGDPGLRRTLEADPANYDVYMAWTKTVVGNPDVAFFSTTELWTLLRDATDPSLPARANDLQDAYEYIMTHPKLYTTLVVFDIAAETDWAEFGLLTPSATLPAGDVHSAPKAPSLEHSANKIRWVRPVDKQPQPGRRGLRQIITFAVKNDGSPVDFYISLGSGKAEVVMEGITYAHAASGHAAWDTNFFLHAEVSPVSEINEA